MVDLGTKKGDTQIKRDLKFDAAYSSTECRRQFVIRGFESSITPKPPKFVIRNLFSL